MKKEKNDKFITPGIQIGRPVFLVLGVILITILLSCFFIFRVRAWTEAPAAPPASNVPGPIWQYTEDSTDYQTNAIWHLEGPAGVSAYLKGMAAFGAKYDGALSYFTPTGASQNILWLAAGDDRGRFQSPCPRGGASALRLSVLQGFLRVPRGGPSRLHMADGGFQGGRHGGLRGPTGV